MRYAAAISLLALGAAVTALDAARALDALPLAAHRAVYELKLAGGGGNRAPADARGRIAFDFTGSACEGYVMNFRQVTEITPNEGASRVSDLRTATFEDGEGKSFRFKTQSTVEGSSNEDADGRASQSGDGAVAVEIVKPKPRKADLGPDIIFPTDHIKRIVAAAKAGKATLSAKVYDGSENGDKLYETLTIIGKPVERAAEEAAAQNPGLRGMARWPVAVSYFSVGKTGDTPDYTLSFDLYENGVSRALKLDYGDFMLTGEMSKLELLPTAPCEK